MFDYLDPKFRGAGFSFPCDEVGNVNVCKLYDAGYAGYRACLAGVTSKGLALSKGRVERFEHYYTNPAVGECDVCGEDVYLRGFTNTCECGIDYNMSGQRLADRSQWGEETGESISDILNIGYDY